MKNNRFSFFIKFILVFCIMMIVSLPVSAASPKLSKSKLTLVKGTNYELKVKKSKVKVKWSSEKKKIAKISKSGKITAKSEGTTKIKADVNGQSLYCKVKVVNGKISKKTLSLKSGETHSLSYMGKGKVKKWESSDNEVASVSSNGEITAKSPGKAIITAKVYDSSLTCEVIVNAPEVQSISINPQEKTILVGESVKVEVTIIPLDAVNQEVTWTSSDNSIASVDNGTITGIKDGQATITAETKNGKKATCSITVQDPARFKYIEVNDIYMESALKQKLGIANNQRISEYDMQKLTTFEIVKGATDADSLKYAINLQEVKINSDNVNNLSVLCSLTKLESISFGFWCKINISFMSQMVHLKKIYFNNPEIVGGELSYLVASPYLETLFFYYPLGNNIDFLEGANNLQDIEIWHGFSTDADISVLLRLNSLKTLKINTFNISDSQNNVLQQLMQKNVTVTLM